MNYLEEQGDQEVDDVSFAWLLISQLVDHFISSKMSGEGSLGHQRNKPNAKLVKDVLNFLCILSYNLIEIENSIFFSFSLTVSLNVKSQ